MLVYDASMVGRLERGWIDQVTFEIPAESPATETCPPSLHAPSGNGYE
jgi:hypothetical protein